MNLTLDRLPVHVKQSVAALVLDYVLQVQHAPHALLVRRVVLVELGTRQMLTN
jgi:hypothetical protein